MNSAVRIHVVNLEEETERMAAMTRRLVASTCRFSASPPGAAGGSRMCYKGHTGGIGRTGEAMTPEMMTTLAAAAGMFVALGGLIVSLFLWLRSDMHRMRDELKSDIGAVETRLRSEIKVVDGKVDALGECVTRLGERVTQLGERMARVEGKLEFLKDFITRRNDLSGAPAE